MKREKGSALLTVILIASVTATIGAAISSFILMNFRLRAYDIQIRRAEYKAEEVIDITHLDLLSEFGKLFSDMKTALNGSIQSEFADLDPNDSSTIADYHSYIGDNWYPDDTLIQNEFLKWFNKLDGENGDKLTLSEDDYTTKDYTIKSIISDIIDNDGDTKTICITDVSDITVDGNMYIILGDTDSEDNGQIKQKVNFYYKIPKNAVIRGNPIAKFSVDYVITCPLYSEVDSSYKIIDYVGITNWKIENNWNL